MSERKDRPATKTKRHPMLRLWTTAMLALSVVGCDARREAAWEAVEARASAVQTEPVWPGRVRTGALSKVATHSHLAPEVIVAIGRLPRDAGWPVRSEFEVRAAKGFAPLRIVECLEATMTVRGGVHDVGALMLGEFEGNWSLLARAGGASNRALSMTWESTEFDPDAPIFTASDAVLECGDATITSIRASPLPFSSSVFAEVLSTPEEPLYVKPKIYDSRDDRIGAFVGKEGWNEQRVKALIELGPPANHRSWRDALGWARSNERLDLAYELHRRYRPMGRCSQDTRPQRNKAEFADVCAELGRPRCQLALSIDLLAYRHARRSDLWIDGKPASYESPVDALPEGLDVPLFLMGLLTHYPVPEGPRPISPQFFALALQGSDLAPTLDAMLVRWLANPETDVWNRHRFAEALFYLRKLSHPSKEEGAHAADVASLPGIPQVTALRLEAVMNWEYGGMQIGRGVTRPPSGR